MRVIVPVWSGIVHWTAPVIVAACVENVMYDRPSRFAELAPAMRVPRPEFYPEQPMTRWEVRMVVEGEAWRDSWSHVVHVWAESSTDAVGRARDDFYGSWATLEDRQRLPLRVIHILQVAV